MKIAISDRDYRVADLSIYNENGVEWTEDLIGDENYRIKNDVTIMKKKDYDFWGDYIEDSIALDRAIYQLEEEIGMPYRLIKKYVLSYASQFDSIYTRLNGMVKIEELRKVYFKNEKAVDKV